MSRTLAATSRHQGRLRQIQRDADELAARVAPALEGVDPSDPDAVEAAFLRGLEAAERLERVAEIITARIVQAQEVDDD